MAHKNPRNDFNDQWKSNKVACDTYWKVNIEKERNHLYQ